MLKDAKKTTFHTPKGNFFYIIMLFGLKNAGAIYQRDMTTMFRDMIGKKVEYYIDDLVVKSYSRDAHCLTLKEVFDRCVNETHFESTWQQLILS